MKTATHKDIEKAIGKGEEWHTLSFPEEFRFYILKHGWKLGRLRDSGLSVMAAWIIGTKSTGDRNTINYSKNRPLYLKNGLEITKGSYSTTPQNIRASFQMRVDSWSELDLVIKELSDKFDIDEWEIKQLTVYNKDMGSEIEYLVFNPDGNGTKLYFHNVTTIDYSRKYQMVPLYEQQELSKYFYDTFAACKLVSDLKPACAIKNRGKK